MGFLTNLISESRSSYTIKDAIQDFLTGKDSYAAETKSGTRVNERIALSLTAVWACVNIISRTMASLPLSVYKNLDPAGKEKASSHYAYDMLHQSPNKMQTSFDWRRLTFGHQLTWGIGVSEIEFKDGYPVALWPIPPWKIRPKYTLSEELYYEVDVKNGKRNLLPEQLLLFPFFSTTAGEWLSPIGVHRETIGSALAVKEFGATVFGQGVNPSGILSGIKFKNTDTEESIREKYGKPYSGLGNSNRLMLLEEGTKFEKVGLPPQDAQYIETQKFNVSEVGRMYTMPSIMLNDHEKSTSWGTGIEEQMSGLNTFTFVPYATQWEQEIQKKILFNDKAFSVKFLFQGLMRAKYSERIDGYVKQLQNGLMCPDDVQELEDRNPLPNGMGKIWMVPLNLQSIEFANRDPLSIKDQGVNKNA
jgi:HK97 family phage portal protein